MAFITILIIIILIVIEAPGMVRKKMWKDFAVYLILMTIATIYSLGYIIYSWSWLPDPLKIFTAMLRPLAKILGIS